MIDGSMINVGNFPLPEICYIENEAYLKLVLIIRNRWLSSCKKLLILIPVVVYFRWRLIDLTPLCTHLTLMNHLLPAHLSKKYFGGIDSDTR